MELKLGKTEAILLAPLCICDRIILDISTDLSLFAGLNYLLDQYHTYLYIS